MTSRTEAGDEASFSRGATGGIDLRITDGSTTITVGGIHDLVDAHWLTATLPPVSRAGSLALRAMTRTPRSGGPTAPPAVVRTIGGRDAGPALDPRSLAPLVLAFGPHPDLHVVAIDVTDVWTTGIDLAGSRALGLYLCDMAHRVGGVVLHPLHGVTTPPTGIVENLEARGRSFNRRILHDDVEVRIDPPGVRLRRTHGNDPLAPPDCELPATAIVASTRLPEHLLSDATKDAFAQRVDEKSALHAVRRLANDISHADDPIVASDGIYDPDAPISSRLSKVRIHPAQAVKTLPTPVGFHPDDVAIRLQDDRKGNMRGFEILWNGTTIGMGQIDRSLEKSKGRTSIHVGLRPEYQGRGAGRRTYDLVDELLEPEGRKLSPSPSLSPSAQILWAKRDPRAFSAWAGEAIAARRPEATDESDEDPSFGVRTV